MNDGQPGKVVLVGSSSAELLRIQEALAGAGLEVVPADEFVLEARELPPFTRELHLRVELRQRQGLYGHGPVVHRKKGKPARW